MKTIISIFLLTALIGCMSVKTSLLYVKNIGNKEIYDVTITSRKGFWFNYGLVMRANKGAGYIGEFPYPDEYTLTWFDSDRKAHSKTIYLQKENSGNLSDDNLNLEFRISQDNKVTVHAAKWLDSPKR
jgi:hypothetical protein